MTAKKINLTSRERDSLNRLEKKLSKKGYEIVLREKTKKKRK